MSLVKLAIPYIVKPLKHIRKKHSTSMAIFELVEDITTAMDNSMSTVGGFIDLKKEFDTVDRNITYY